MTTLRRAWSVLRLGLIWMVIWGAIGAARSVNMARILGGVGAGSGLLFGLLVSVVERMTRVADLPYFRGVLWGIAAGAALPLLAGINDSMLANTIPLGALSGMACVALARARRRWDLFGPEHHRGT